MQLKNTADKFGLLAVLNHWVGAALFIAIFLIGQQMEDLPRGPELFEQIALHKSLAVLFIALFALRLVWTLINPKPNDLNVDRKLDATVAKVVKHLLYLVMVLMPLSGWIMSNAGGHAVSFFGLFDLPTLVAENEGLKETAGSIHGIVAKVAMVSVILHVLGAIKQQVVYKNGVFKRMLP